MELQRIGRFNVFFFLSFLSFFRLAKGHTAGQIFSQEQTTHYRTCAALDSKNSNTKTISKIETDVCSIEFDRTKVVCLNEQAFQICVSEIEWLMLFR